MPCQYPKGGPVPAEGGPHARRGWQPCPRRVPAEGGPPCPQRAAAVPAEGSPVPAEGSHHPEAAAKALHTPDQGYRTWSSLLLARGVTFAPGLSFP